MKLPITLASILAITLTATIAYTEPRMPESPTLRCDNGVVFMGSTLTDVRFKCGIPNNSIKFDNIVALEYTDGKTFSTLFEFMNDELVHIRHEAISEEMV